MIRIYRPTRYPDRDYFIFQASPETLAKFRSSFPLQVRSTRRGFEQGYFCWLRDVYRDRYFDAVREFFRKHYSPPEIKLSIFRSTTPLSARWPLPFWERKVTGAIQQKAT